MSIRKAKDIIQEAIDNDLTALNLSGRLFGERLTSADIAELLPNILKVKNLQELTLEDNQISDITPILELKNLRSLNLNENQISDITLISELKSLEVLELHLNQIREIPKEIDKLKSLKLLGLYKNQISEIPDELGELENLTLLVVENNQIRLLPKAMGKLKNLKTFYLADNQISDISPITGLKNLKQLYISGNKGLEEKIPTEILEDDNNAQNIFNYFLKVTQGVSRPLNEAKIVVIGEADVGKTCLINKLVYNRTEETDSTHGIQIHRWEDVKINNKNIQLNVWDFGGQEIMHSTHQFFFTKRTIYILVIDARKNEDMEKTVEWLERIKSFGGDSPVIIVGNQIDQNKRNASQKGVGYFDINRRGLQDKYKNIKEFYGLCAYDEKVADRAEKREYGRMFEKFKKELIEEIGRLEGIDTPFPSDWFAVKEDLETMHEKDIPYISKTDYIRYCIDRNVREQIDQTTIVEFLNEVGTIIYFEDLPDTMVFNPEWITKGVYAIVDNPLIKDNKGILKREYLKTLLEPKDYPEDKHDYILDMMKKFQLCVDVEENKTFLLPDLLSTSQPEEIKEEDWKNTLGFQYHYETYLPNIFTRFIVKMYDYRHKDLYWRNGIVLEYKQSKALVKADVVGKKIEISVKGNNRRENQILLTKIRTGFSEIHNKFALLSIRRKVPHPNYPQIEPKDYDELIIMEEAGEAEVFVKELRGKLPISDWLDGVESPAERRKNTERKGISGEEHFAEYSPVSTLPARFEEDNTAIIKAAKEEIAKLEDDIKEFETIKENLDRESKKVIGIYLKASFVVLSFVVLFWISIIFILGWEVMEKWTYIVGVLLALSGYGYFALTTKQFNPFNFYERAVEREKENNYKLIGLDLNKQKNRQERLERLNKELRKMVNE